MEPKADSLEDGYAGSSFDPASSPAQGVSVVEAEAATRGRGFRVHYNRTALLVSTIAVGAIVLIGVGSVVLTSLLSNNKSGNDGIQNSSQSAANYPVGSLPVQSLKPSEQLQVGEADRLLINGQLQVNNTLVLAPTSSPTSPVPGQVYYDKTTNQPYYFNGSQFIDLDPSSLQRVTALGGAAGVIGLGSGLQITNNQLNIASSVLQQVASSGTAGAGVTSLQGLTGAVSLREGPGVSISGTTITNSGVLSITGTANQVAVSVNTGDVVLSLPQSIDATANVQFNSLALGAGDLTLAPAAAVHTDSILTVNNGDSLTINGSNNIAFVTANGANSFTFPVVGGTGQVLCTTVTCAGAAGANASLSNLSNVAINTTLLGGTAGAVNLGSGALPFGQLFIAGTSITPATNNFLLTGTSTGGTRTVTLPDASGTVCLENSPSCGFALGSSGVTSLNTLTGALTIANATGAGNTVTINDASTAAKGIAEFNGTNFSVGTGIVNTVQDIATGATPTFAGLSLGAALTVPNGGTGATSFTANGILFGNGTNAIQVTTPAANSVLATDGSSVPGLTQTLPAAVQGNITQVGVLASGSITTGFGTISTNSGIATTTSVQGGTVNATSTLEFGGVSINTAGTLSDVAYLDQGNNFSAANNRFTASGTALSVTNNASIGGVLTLGVAGGTTGSLVLATSGSATNQVTIASAVQANDVAITIPADSSSSDTLCLQTLGNCTTAGTVTTTLGTQNFITKYNNAGATQITNSEIYDNGSGVAIGSVSPSGLFNVGATNQFQVSGTGVITAPTSGNTINGLVISGGALSGVTTLDASGSITTSTTVQGNILNATGGGSVIELNGTSINTAGTLSNVAYLNQANNFTVTNNQFTGAGTALSVTNNASVGGALAVQGAGGLTLGSGTAVGVANFLDGTNDGFTTAIQSATQANDVTLTIPADTNTADIICLKQLANCSAGGGLFIENQTTLQTNANFNIAGIGSSVTAVIQGATGGGDITDFKSSGGSTVASIGASGALTAVGVNAGSGSIQGTGGLTVSGAASITGGLNNNNGNITNTGSLGSVTGYTQTSGTFSQTYSSSTNNATAATWTVTNSNAGATATTVNGQSIALAGTANTNSNANTLNGLNFNSVTPMANNTFNGLYFGTGYDSLFNYNGTSIISGSGILQNAGLSGTYSNALTFGSASNSFTGNGNGLTNLNASNLSSGTVPSGVVSGTYGNITGTGALTSGSIASGFGTINTNNDITTSTTVQGNILNATGGGSVIELNGTSINTAGTLSNVAYLNQANNFTVTNNQFTGAGTALSVTNNASVGGALAVQGAGGLTLGSGTAVGVANFLDGTNDGFTTAIQSATQANDVTLTIPADTNTADIICLKQLANCSAGGGLFIENQTTLQTNANFNIAGIGSSVTAVIQGATGGGDITDFKSSGGSTVASIGASGALTAVGVNAGSGSIQGTGGLTVSGAASITGGLNNNNGNITNTGSLGSVTGYTQTSGTFSQTYSSSTNNATAATWTVTNSNAGATATTVNGQSIALAGTANTNSNANTLNGLNFNSVTPMANNTFNGLYFGTGYDSLFNYNGTSIISGSGILQNAGLSGTYSNALTFGSASNSFTGNGNGLTNLNASNLSSGTVPSGVVSGTYGNITGTGALTSGSIASGFGTINTNNDITTSTTVQGNILNATGGGSVIELNGTSINTAGTLSNVAYLNQANNFTVTNNQFTGAGTALSVTNNASVGGALTVGTAGTTTGSLVLATIGSATNKVTITSATQANNVALSIPADTNTTDTVCLLTLANCVGTGGSVSTTAGTQNFITKYNNAGATQITNSEIYDNGSGVAIGSVSPSGLFNVGATNQFQVSNAGAVTAVGVNAGSGSIQGTGGLTVSGAASITGGLNNNNGNITNTGSLGSVTGYTQTSGTLSVTSATTSGSILSLADTALNTNGANLGQLTFTNANSSATSTTVNGLSITPTGTTNGNSNANTLNAINLPNVTPVANNTFSALNIGTGYTNILEYNGAQLINGTGIVQSGAINGTYGNLTGTGALAAGSLTTGFGTINIGSSITTSSTVQGSSVQGNTVTVGTAGTTTGSLVLATSGSATNQVTIASAVQANDVAITIPADSSSSDTLCLQTLGNCTTAGTVTTTLGTQNFITKYNNAGATQITNSEIYDNGSGVAIGSVSPSGLFNVGATNQFQVSGTGVITAPTSGNTINGLVISGGALSGVTTLSASGLLTDSANTTGLSLTGTPTAGTGITALLELGNAITGGNSGVNGGTYLGINEPAAGAGSTADFVNFQNNGAPVFAISSNGATTVAGLTTLNGGATILGTTSINTSGSASTNINTGSNTGNVAIGNSTGSFSLTSSALTVSTAGALGGITTITTSGNINTTAGTFQLNGTSINTAGTLSNVAYLNQANNFTVTNNQFTGAGTALSVTNNASVGGALTVGTAGTTTGSLVLATIGSATNKVTITSATQANNVALSIPADTNTTDTVCLLTLANCVGTGGSITGSGTAGTLAEFNNTGSITDAPLTDSSGDLTASGAFTVQGSGGLTLGVASSTTGKAIFATSANGRTITLQAASQSVASSTITIPDTAGSNDTVCLAALNNCAGGGGGGISGSGTANYVARFTSPTALGTGVLYDDGTDVSVGGTSPAGLFNVGATNQFQVSNAGAVTAVGVNAGSGSIQGTGGLTVSGAASITGGLNNNNGNITNTGSLGSVTGYTQTSGTLSVTSATTSGSILSLADTALNTNGANLGQLTFTNANSSATSTTVNGLSITPTGTTNGNSNANTLNAINLPNVTPVANNTFSALNIGTGYTNILEYNGAQLINGTGIVQSGAINGTYGNLTGTGALAAGSLTTGFGTINIGSSITTSTTVQGNILNATGGGSVIELNGTSINTAGTLSNVAYLNAVNQSFTGQNTFNRNGTGTGDYSLGVTGTPINDATSSLLRIGNAIAGGNNAANGGTYLGINEPGSGSGTAADFLNFQNNGTVELKVTSGGAVTANGGLTTPGNINTTAGTFQLNGTSINTAGTLSNVAYLNQANNFTVTNNQFTGAGTALSVTNNASVGGALTVGTAGTTTGSLVLATSGSATNKVTITSATQANNVALSIPADTNTTDTVCLLTLANCVGTGGSVSTTAGTQNFITKYNNAGATQITNSEIYDNGSGVAIGSVSPSGLFNVGATNQFQVSNAGAVTAVGVNAGSGSIQGTGGLTVSGAASITGGLNNNNGNITNTGSLGSVTGYTQTSGTFSQTYSSSTNNATAATWTVTNSNAGATATTVNGQSIALAGTANTNSNANTLNGLNFNSVTPMANNTFNGLYFGTGYDSLFNYNGTSIISGSGILQNAGLSGTYSNALTFGSASNSFTGNGNGLTNLNASNLSSGTVPSGVVSGTYGNITGTGALTSGSIASGFGTINTNNDITTSTTVQGNILNATGGGSVIELNGTSINTAGTLSNVAYLNQANNFTVTNNQFTGAGTALSVTNNASVGGALTVGTAGTTTGSLVLATIGSATNKVTITSATQANNVALSIPADTNTTDTVCLLTLANCVGTGGSVSTTAGTQNFITKYNNAGATQITNSEIYDNGSGVAIGSVSPSGLFNVGATNQFQVSNAGAVTAVGVNAGSGSIQGTGGLTVSGAASITGGLNNNNGNITNTGSLGSVTGYTQTSGTLSVTSATTSGSILSLADTALNTNGANLGQLTFTNANSSATSTTVNGLSITPTGTTNGNSNANTLNAINLPNVTPVANNTFSALNIGTGYTNILEYNGAQLINGTGIVQSGAINGTYGNLTGTGALAAGSLTTGFGTINIGSSITTSTTVQGNILNATGGGSVIELNGTSINTAGTLSNVAYLNQANNFTVTNNQFTGAGTALSVTNNASVGGALTVGTAGTTTGSLVLATIGSATNKVTITSATQANNVALSIPADTNTTDTVCLLTLANCVGTGGSVSTTAGTQNFITKYNNAGATQITNSEIYDNGSGVAIGSVSPSGLFNVGATNQFQVSNAGAVTAVGVNAGSGSIQGTGGLTVSGAASITGGLNNNNGNITNTGSLGSVTGYTQTSGTLSVTSATTSGSILSLADTALNTNGANLGQLTFTNANSSATSTTVNGLSITPTGTTNGNSNANTLNAINLPNVTPVANNTFSALNIGTGYTNILEYNGAQLINGTGIVQSGAINGTYGNLTGTGALAAGSLTTGFGTINIGSSITTSSTVQGSSVQGNTVTVGTAGTTTGSLVLATSGSATNQVTIASATQANNVALSIPADTNTTDTVCLATLSNCSAVGTAGGDLTGTYPSPTIAKLQGKTLTVSATPTTGAVLQYNGTAFVDGLITNANLTTGTYSSITGTGALAAGSLTTGFGTINIGSSITTSTTVQGNILNATGGGSVIELNGTSINTAGTLSNVAYLNQANNFTVTNNQFTGAGTALSVTNNASVGGALTVGTAGTTTGSLVLATIGSATNKVTITSATQANNVALSIPADTNTTDTVCLQTLANCLGGPSGGANVALSNLSGVAINTSLLPASNNAIDAGSAALTFRSGYFGTGLQAPLLQTADGAGASSAMTIRSGNTTGGTGLSTGSVTITSGSGSGTTSSSGNVTIDSGSISAGGTAGVISIGASNTSAVSLGRSAATFSLTSSALTVSTAGALGGITTITTSGNINTTAGTFQLNGTSINTAGTLSNVAYLNQANNFTVTNNQFTGAGTALSVTNNASVGGALTVGTAGTTTGSLVLATSGSATNKVTITSATQANNVALSIPADTNTTDTVCLLTLANCVGTGGSVSTTAGTQNFITKYNNAGATQITNSEIYDNGSGVAIGSVSPSGLFNVGATNQFQVSNAGAVTAVGVNAGSGSIQGTGGLTVSGAASITGGLNNNNGNITNTGSLGSVTGYTQTSGTLSVTSATTSGSILSLADTALNTNGANLGQLTFTNANSSATSTTVNGLSITPTGTTNGNSNANTLNAINLPNVTPVANNTFSALNIGTGYTNILEYNGAQLINGTGIVQSGAINGTYGNLTGTGALAAGSLTTGFGTINIGSSITTSSTVQGSSVQGNTVTVGTAGTTTGSLVLATSGSATNKVTITSATQANNVALSIPADTNTTDTVCLLTLANCVGTGGSVSTTAGTQNFITKYNNAGATQITNSEIYDNGSGVAIGSVSPSGLFNVGATNQFQVSNAGAVTAVGVNAGSGSIQGTGGLTVSGAASITGGLNNNNGNITNTGSLGSVTGYTQTSGTLSVTSATTSGSILSLADTALNTNGANLGQLTFTNANSSATSTTVNGLSITPTGTTNGNSNANTLNAINLPNVTPVANNTFSALNIGTGYTNILEYNGAQLINGTGIVQSGAINGTYGNLTGTGALAAGSLTTGFGTINIGSSITTSSTVQGSSVQGNTVTVGTAGTTTGSLVLATIGSATNKVTIASATQANNVALSIPADTNTTDTVCLATLSNCSAVGTAGGDLTGTYPSPTIAKLQGKTLTVSATPTTGAVLQYNGTAFVDGLITNANLTTGTYSSITGTGALAAGSLTTGFGTINIGSSITTSTTVQGNILNATGGGSVIELNGTSINTAGTLSNVAYLNAVNQSFTGQNTFNRNGTGTGDYSLGVTGTPINDATSSLLRIGNAIAGGNNAANGGTYLGINEPGSGSGTAADFLNFQNNGTVELKVTSGGAVTANGGLTVNSGGAAITGASSITGPAAGSSVALTLNTGAASNTGIVINGASGQTAGLLQMNDSTGATIQGIDVNGNQEQLGYLDTPYGGFGSSGNLLLFSEQFDNAAWTKTNVTATANDATSNPAPDGNTTADKLVSTAAGGLVFQVETTGVNGTYDYSVWVKATSGTQPFKLRIDSTGATPTTGTATNFTATTTWQRFNVSQTFTGTPTQIKPVIVITNNAETLVAWGGDMVLGKTTAGVYVRTVGAAAAATDGLVNNGNAIFQNAVNSTTAFQVLEAGGNNVLNVDTTNQQVQVDSTGIPLVLNSTGEDGILFKLSGTNRGEIGLANGASQIITGTAANDLAVKSTNGNILFAANGTTADLTINTSGNLIVATGSTGEATPKLVVLDSGTASTDPGTEIDGAMYYNSNMDSFRCGQNGQWVACNGLVFNTTTSSTVTINTTSTTTPQSFAQTYSAPANDCQPGVSYIIDAAGDYGESSLGTGPFALNIWLSQGGTILAEWPGATTNLSISHGYIWTAHFIITCRSTISAEVSGHVSFGVPSNQTDASTGPNPLSSSPYTWSAAANAKIDIGASWSGTNGTGAHMDQFIVQRLGP